MTEIIYIWKEQVPFIPRFPPCSLSFCQEGQALGPTAASAVSKVKTRL